LQQTGVAVTPGTAYGDQGAGRVRICFGAAPNDIIEDAMNRIEKMAAQGA
jgi:aspartate/methionine/tyrosine aminotransferase